MTPIPTSAAPGASGSLLAILPLLTPLLLASCGDRALPYADAVAFRQEAPLLWQANPSTAVALRLPDQEPALKIIRTGELRLEVRDVEKAAVLADSIARLQSGFVTESQRAIGENGKRSAHLTLRVPAERFAPSLVQLRGLGSVRNESLSQEDVTRVYTDLETRLAVKEQTVARLRQLLATRTGKLSDVVDIEREIYRVVTEIEQIKGEKKYYDNRLALSTIGLTLYEPGAFRPSPSLTIAGAFGRSLETFATSIAWLVYIATFLAPWIVLACGLWFLGRYLRRRKRAS